jgi:hypothetical protein
MTVFLVAFAVVALAFLGMAAGVILGRGALRGSCGGLATIEGLEKSCPACAAPCEERQQELARRAAGRGAGSPDVRAPEPR